MNVNMNDSFTKCLTATGNLINLMQHKRIFFYLFSKYDTCNTGEKTYIHLYEIMYVQGPPKNFFFFGKCFKKNYEIFC